MLTELKILHSNNDVDSTSCGLALRSLSLITDCTGIIWAKNGKRLMGSLKKNTNSNRDLSGTTPLIIIKHEIYLLVSPSSSLDRASRAGREPPIFVPFACVASKLRVSACM